MLAARPRNLHCAGEAATSATTALALIPMPELSSSPVMLISFTRDGAPCAECDSFHDRGRLHQLLPYSRNAGWDMLSAAPSTCTAQQHAPELKLVKVPDAPSLCGSQLQTLAQQTAGT